MTPSAVVLLLRVDRRTDMRGEFNVQICKTFSCEHTNVKDLTDHKFIESFHIFQRVWYLIRIQAVLQQDLSSTAMGAHSRMVFCMIRNIRISLFKYILPLSGHAMSQTISRQPVIAKGQVRSQIIPCTNCWWTTWHSVRGFLRVRGLTRISIIPPVLHPNTFFHHRHIIIIIIYSVFN